MFRIPGEIAVVAVGKMRTRHWTTAQDDYLKRLRRYGRFQLTEIKDAVGRGMPDVQAMMREGAHLLKASTHHRRILLTPTGQTLTSPQLAAFLKKQTMQYNRIAFLVGGPLGFSPDVQNAADTAISLSHLTFTHEMARVLLLEQLYRACTIINGEKYHK